MEQLALDLGIPFSEAEHTLIVAVEGLRASAAKACGMTDPRDQAAFDAWVAADHRRVQQARSAARMVGMRNDLTGAKELVKAWRKSAR